MKRWLPQVGVFVIAGITYLVGQYFRGVWFLGSSIPNVCGNAQADGRSFCNSPYLETLGFPLITLGEFLAAIGVVLLFANQRGLRAWAKFSLWYVPIATFLVLWIYPIHFGTFFLINATAGYDVGVRNACWLYLVVTIAIVLYAHFQRRSLTTS